MVNKLAGFLDEVFNRSIRTTARGSGESVTTIAHFAEVFGIEDDLKTGDLSNPPSNGMVAWWPMDKANLSESGNVLRDATRNYSGLVMGSPTFVGGNIREAFNIANGDTTTYLDVGVIEEFDNAQAFSWHFVFKSSDAGHINTIMSRGPNTDTEKQFRIYYNGTTLFVRLREAGGTQIQGSITTDGDPTDEQKVTVVFDGSLPTDADKLKVWLNGTKRTVTFLNTFSTPATIRTGAGHSVRIGDEQGHTDRKLNGWVDEVVLWNRALNEEETNLMQNIYKKSHLVGSAHVGEVIAL